MAGGFANGQSEVHLFCCGAGGELIHAKCAYDGQGTWIPGGGWTVWGDVLAGGAAGNVGPVQTIGAAHLLTGEDGTQTHLAVLSGGHAYHCIRLADGGWTKLQRLPNETGGYSLLGWKNQACFTVDSSVGVAFSFRKNHEWSTKFENVGGLPHGTAALVDICGIGQVDAPSEQQCAVVTSDGGLLHKAGFVTWTEWASVLADGAAGGQGSEWAGRAVRVACCAGFQSTHYFVVNHLGQLFHCARYRAGGWTKLRLVPGAANLGFIREVACTDVAAHDTGVVVVAD
jgi:hypothetical protein